MAKATTATALRRTPVSPASATLGLPLSLKTTCTGSISGTVRPEMVEPQWSVTSGGGSVDGLAQTATPTNGEGVSQVHWSLGDGVGTQTVTATVGSQTYAFTATAVMPRPGGTCTDLVDSTGTNFEAQRNIEGSQTWTLAGSPYRGTDVQVFGTLRIDPGVQVCIGSLFVNYGRLLARGTAALPIRMSGPAPRGLSMTIVGSNASPISELAFVQADGVSTLSAQRTALIEDSLFTAAPGALCRTVLLTNKEAPPGAAPTVVQRTTFDGFGTPGINCTEAVVLSGTSAPATGVSIFSARVIRSTGVGVRVDRSAKDWRLQQCELTGSGSHGLLAETGAVSVSACAISANAGNGIQNASPTTTLVNARGNWWGDAAGPLGAAGDGVSAGVDASQPLPAPPVLGY
jgi:hypothetical protein